MAKIPGYILNLDPAVLDVPYGANIDIRDTVHAPSKLVALVLCPQHLAQYEQSKHINHLHTSRVTDV